MVTRVQGPARNSTLGSPSIVTLGNAPTAGNVLIAVIGLVGTNGVSHISQSEVSWTMQEEIINPGGVINEIWLGTVGSGADETLTVYSDCGPNYRQQVNVCEYSGISASPKDKSDNNYGDYTTTTDTGTTDTTTQGSELWIGGITACSSVNPAQGSPTQDFYLFDGVADSYTYGKQSLAYLEKVVTSTGNAHSGTTTTTNANWAGCIVTFRVNTGTVVVPYDGRYAGIGSKQTTINWNGTDTIMQVESNVPNNLDRSAVIENLVIDGGDSNNAVGILLENVYNCCIRNVTIKNCNVGIKVRITGSNWSHANRFEHIRMINVKTGILFIGTSTNKDFSHTIIDDVGISLTGGSSSIGIKVGDPYANLYSAFIKATVWLTDTSGVGMEVNGELKLSLVNLEVEEATQYSGYGVYISSTGTVYDNQSFLLTALGIGEDNILKVDGTLEEDGITVFSQT